MTSKPLATVARSRTKMLLIVGGLILAMNAAVYAFVVRPRIAEYRDLEGTRDKFMRELTEADRAQKTLADFYARAESTKENTGAFYTKILRTKQENLINVQREILEIGQEFNIDPDTMAYTNTEMPEDGLEKFNVAVLLEGDYGDLRKYIARIENSDSFLVIESVALQGTREGGLQLQMNINITTYFDAPWLKDLKKPARASRKRA